MRTALPALLAVLCAGCSLLFPADYSFSEDAGDAGIDADAGDAQVDATDAQTDAPTGCDACNPCQTCVADRCEDDWYAPVNAVAAGADHTCAIDGDGALWCWGANDEGQLGKGNRLYTLGPVLVDDVKHWIGIASGARHSCGMVETGLYCWGANDSCQLTADAPDRQTTPLPMETRGDLMSVVLGDSHTCQITHVGALCVGANETFQLGRGTSDGSNCTWAFADWGPDPTGYPGAAAGARHTCQIGSLGAGDPGAWCWGANARLQSGDVPGRVVPGEARKLRDTALDAKLGAGGEHTCLLTGTSLECWGDNRYGQLGSGPSDDLPVYPPESVQGTWKAVSLGGRHSCAIASEEDTLHCWGANDEGQLGGEPGDPIVSPEPVTVVGDPVRSVSAGANHTCAITAARDLYCWGDNRNGQLGASDRDPRSGAVHVCLQEEVDR